MNRPVITLLTLVLGFFAACALPPVAGIEAIKTSVVIDTTGADIDSTVMRRVPLDSTNRNQFPRLVGVPMLVGPVPGSVRGQRVVAVFSVDERGEVTRISLNPPRDRDYARRYVETLLTYTFMPAMNAEGKPMSGRYTLVMDF